jgi:hypothetical protein
MMGREPREALTYHELPGLSTAVRLIGSPHVSPLQWRTAHRPNDNFKLANTAHDRFTQSKDPDNARSSMIAGTATTTKVKALNYRSNSRRL